MRLGRDQATWIALAGILLFGLFLRVFFWYGLVNVDPYAYADAAESIARGLPVFDPNIAGHLYYTQYLRLSLVVPAAVAFKLFGPGEVQATVFPIACSLATGVVALLLVMHIAKDRFAALIAAFITVVFPESVINSTQFLPDTVLAFFSALTILLFWKGLDSAEQPWRRRATWFALTGIAWALAFYSRQTAAGLVLPLAVLTLYKRRFDPAILAGIPGAILVASAASVLLVSLGGHAFEDIKVTVTEGRSSQPGALGYTDLDWTYLRTFTHDEKYVPVAILALLGLVLVAFTWRSRPAAERNQLVALLIVTAGLFIYFEFFMRLPTLYSWIKEPRYALVLVVPLSAFAGIGFSALVRAFEGRTRTAAYTVYAVPAAALSLMAIASVLSVRDDYNYWRAHRIDQLARDVASAIHGRPEPVVYTWNDDLSRYMSLYVGLDRNSVYERHLGEGYLQNWFDAEGRSRVTPGSLVVISPGQDHWSKPTAHAPFWNEVWSDGNGTSVWSVPISPPPAPQDPVSVVLSPQLSVTGFGLSQPAVFPQQHVVLSATLSNRGEAAKAAFSLECGSEQVPLASFEVPKGEMVTSTDVAINVSGGASATRDCTVVASDEGGQPAPIASVQVGGLVRIEPEDLLTYDAASATGWYRRDYAAFSSGAAIATAPYQPLTIPIPVVQGDLWLDLGLFDYGTGENALVVTLNGVSSRITWGSGASGLVHRQVALTAVPEGSQLTIAVESVGQEAVTFDSLVISSIAPPAP